MASGIQFDRTGFHAGLQRKLAATKRAGPTVVNKAMGNVCLRAASFTPKADRAKIETELRTGGLLFKLLQSPTFQSRLPRKLRGFTRGTHTRAQIDAAATLLLRARNASVGAIRAGFVKAAQAFGMGQRQRVSARGNPGKSYGVRATSSQAVATAANLATGAVAVGSAPLAHAMEFVGKDLSDYAEKTLAQPWR